jgi:hypothetical protein
VANLDVFLRHPSESKTQTFIHIGTNSDTQAEADDYTSWLGAGYLETALSAGAITEIKVTAEKAGAGFNDAGKVRISDGTHEEFVDILTVAWSENVATLSCSAILSYSYAVNSYVSSVLEIADAEIFSIWIKEITTPDIPYCQNNVNRIRFYSSGIVSKTLKFINSILAPQFLDLVLSMDILEANEFCNIPLILSMNIYQPYMTLILSMDILPDIPTEYARNPQRPTGSVS